MKQKKEYRFVTHPKREQEQTIFMLNEIINKVYLNIEERHNKGIDQTKTKAIMDNILQISKQDPRLLAENNLGNGGGKDMYDNQHKTVDPRDLRLYEKLMVEANAQLGYFKLPEDMFGHH